MIVNITDPLNGQQRDIEVRYSTELHKRSASVHIIAENSTFFANIIPTLQGHYVNEQLFMDYISRNGEGEIEQVVREWFSVEEHVVQYLTATDFSWAAAYYSQLSK